MFYYRVETMDYEDGVTVGGYVSASLAMTYKALCLMPGCSAEVLCTALKHTDSKNALTIYRNMAVLGSIAQPEVYVNDKPNHYCLYTQDEFLAVIPAFEEIDKVIREESDGLYFLIYRRVKIPDEAIIYEDEDQIVISKEDYERFVAKEDFHEIAEWDDDWSELGA